MSGKTKNMDMVTGPLWGNILTFSLTFMLTAVLQHLYNAADVLIVGRYGGQEALAGVGTCGVLVDLFLNFIIGLAAGATVVLGQAIGARKTESIGRASHTAIAIAVYGGTAACVICMLFAKPLLKLIDVPDNVMPQAVLYLRIVAIGFVPSLIYNFGASILRAKGDTKRALYIVSISGVINVVLNLFFVCILKMKADGVALATVISQVFTAVMILNALCHETDAVRINFRKIRIHKEEFWRIFKIGIPTGIQSSVYSFSNIIVQSSINGFGSATIAGSAATSSITKFYNVMMNSLYQAAIVFTSQNFGAKQFGRIKSVIKICYVYVLALGVIQSAVTFFGGRWLVSLYVPGDMAAIEMGVRKINIVGYSYAFLGCMNVLSGVLRGMGASLLNMITSVVGVCGIRIAWIMTVFAYFGTIETLYFCYPISWVGTGCMHFIMFLYVFRKEKKRYELQVAPQSS